MLSAFSKKYLKMCDLTTKSTFEEAKKRLLWGTYGKPAIISNFKWVKLIDCSSEHLTAILTSQPQIPSITKKIINSILQDRAE